MFSVESIPITPLTNYTGTISWTGYTTNSFSRWQIFPSNPSPQFIEINFLSLSSSNSVIKIYDFDDLNSGIILFACVVCGDLPPPIIQSRTGNILIYAETGDKNTGTFGNFVIQYFSKTNLPLDSQSTIDLSLNLGYSIIEPLLYSGKIPPSSTQIWRINVPINQPMTFSFSRFIFDESCLCSLKIYDGQTTSDSLLFSACRNEEVPREWLFTTSNKALVVLKNTDPTNSVVADFQLYFRSDTDLWQCGSFLQPDLQSSPSMWLSDGSQSSSTMRRGDTCTWLISPSTSSQISLVFSRVSLKMGAYVKVFDSHNQSGTLLWNGQGMTTTIPPIITSSGSNLFVVYSSNDLLSVGFYGFQATYWSLAPGVLGSGDRQLLLGMSSTLDLSPPAVDIALYPTDYTYHWFISPTMAKGPLTLIFSLLNLTNQTELTIFDGLSDSGPIIARFFGNHIQTPKKWFKTTSNSTTLRFRTTSSCPSLRHNSSSQVAHYLNTAFEDACFGNFKLSYYSDGFNYHCGFPTNPARLNALSSLLTDGTSSWSSVEPNQNCQWLLSPLTTPSQAIYYYFTRYDVSGGSLSFYQHNLDSSTTFVTIGPSATAVPVPFLVSAWDQPELSSSDSLGLLYETSDSASGNGFSLSYFGIPSDPSITYSPGDGIIRLHCSSITSLTLPSNYIPPFTNLTWLITPDIPPSDRIYLSLTSLTLLNSSLSLQIFDGPSFDSPLLANYSSETTFEEMNRPWLVSSQSSVSMRFLSTDPDITEGNFELSYYSDGPNYHCGFLSNPAILSSPSSLFTDGSPSQSAMFENQDCQWRISPSLDLLPDHSQSNLAPTTIPIPIPFAGTIVLELLSLDLRGGHLKIYDGINDQGSPLWRCSFCTTLPPPLLALSGSLFIQFRTNSTRQLASAGMQLGTGFSAMYWTKIDPPSLPQQQQQYPSPKVLSSPLNLPLSNIDRLLHSQGQSGSWLLGLDSSGQPSSLSHFNDPHAANSSSMYYEGRLNHDEFFDWWPKNVSQIGSHSRGSFDSLQFCGLVSSPSPSSYRVNQDDLHLSFTATQPASHFLSSTYKQLFNFTNYHHLFNPTVPAPPLPPPPSNVSSSSFSPSAINNSFAFQSSHVCSYFVDSGNYLSLTLDLKRFVLPSGLSFSGSHSPRLRIFAGYTGTDRLIWDSHLARPRPSSFSSSSTQHSFHDISLLAPCGKAMILLESGPDSSQLNNNYTFFGSPIPPGSGFTPSQSEINDYYSSSSFSSSSSPLSSQTPFQFQLEYSLNVLDQGQVCIDYLNSLLPQPKKVDPWLNYEIYGGGGLGLVLIVLILYFNRKKLNDIINGRKPHSYSPVPIITPVHPRYSPFLDSVWDRFLPKGVCCVCSEERVSVYLLPCSHRICKECLKGYVEAALGDISMFPVKCPMHFESCEGRITAVQAKRVLSEPLYGRFLEFADRAEYGEGTRCIFCDNYVTYANHKSGASQLDCPHCKQKFCLRCKKPWHFSTKCPLEVMDDSLEVWKQGSHAQKCPSCQKLIEKSDLETCHHMIHKLTDGDPCCRDRTDFCYLCGEEVLPNYPHDEVNNKGVNHFPDGVFQKCRIVQVREREEEVERIKRMKRMNGSKKSATISPEADLGRGGGGGGNAQSNMDILDERWGAVAGPVVAEEIQIANDVFSPANFGPSGVRQIQFTGGATSPVPQLLKPPPTTSPAKSTRTPQSVGPSSTNTSTLNSPSGTGRNTSTTTTSNPNSSKPSQLSNSSNNKSLSPSNKDRRFTSTTPNPRSSANRTNYKT